MCYCFFFFLRRVRTLEPSGRKHRMNFNTMELEVNTHSAKQRIKNNIGRNSEKMSLYSIARTKKKKIKMQIKQVGVCWMMVRSR